MGRRGCEKPNVNYRKGLWSPDEDQRLRAHILKHGVSCWSAVPAKAGLQRNRKSCRLRWINYLRPGLKHGNFSREEEEIVIMLQAKLGNKWSQIAMHLPGRTDNEVKNYWNSYLKKKVNSKAQNKYSDSTHQSFKKHEEEPTICHQIKHNNLQQPLQNCAEDYLSEPNNASNCSNGSDQVISSVCADLKAAALPRVLFGEWLSLEKVNNGEGLRHDLEEAQWQNSISSSWQTEFCMPHVEQGNEGIFNGYGEMQAQPEANLGQINADNNGLFDLLFPGVI
ncbi:hypothetical protein Cni_G07087 [Canna indica]|uniref:Uncharacterized protein n=1 Tax=Canna indica TaxID=4628 RepID=A0AAQ3JYH4_9LILI|nr:hypothetical protein Cni_G07087 [Canna indica]